MNAAEREVDALYEAPPDAFTKKRDTLSRELKSEGDEELAAEVKRLRKPTRIAYVLNQLARRHPDSVADLVDVGRDLARAQREALRGRTSEALRDVIVRQREVVSDVTRQAGELMRELDVGESGLDEVAGALRAALVDPAVGAALEEGRLEKAPAAAAGFPGADLALEVAPSAKPVEKERESTRRLTKKRTKELRSAKQKARAEAKHAAAVERRRALVAKVDAAEEDARAREDEASAAARIAKERQERVEALVKDLAEARREATQAAKTARALAARARAAQKTAHALSKRAKKR